MTIVPGHISLSQASDDLNRHKMKLVDWCGELNIPIRPVGKRNRYISKLDFDRLKALSDRRPRERYKLSPRFIEWDPTLGGSGDRDTAARTTRDKEVARRIEAASQWKLEHYGAYIDDETLLRALAAMSAMTAQ